MSKKRGRTRKIDDDVASPKRKKKFERKTTKEFVDVSVSKLEMLKTTLGKKKVKELREELENRGLDKKGKKAILIERLAEAMVEEEEKRKAEIAKRKREQEEAAAAAAAAKEKEMLESEEKKLKMDEESTKEDTTTTTNDPRTKRRKKSRWGGTASAASTTTTTTTATTTTTIEVTPPPEQAQKTVPKNDNENHDINYWSALLQSASSSSSLAEAAPKYERVVKKYPSTSMYWRIYADHCLREGNFDRVASIFRRALPVCRQVDLFVRSVAVLRVSLVLLNLALEHTGTLCSVCQDKTVGGK